MLSFALVLARAAAESVLLITVSQEVAVSTSAFLIGSNRSRSVLRSLLALTTMSVALIHALIATVSMLQLSVRQEITSFSVAVAHLDFLAALAMAFFTV